MPTQKHYTKRGKLPVFENDRDLQKYLETSFTESLRQLIKVTVSTMIKTEMEQFRQEFNEKLQFNGNYDRNFVSTFGEIKGVPVPRFRQSVEGMELKSMEVFDQERGKFEKLIGQMHLMGVSQRKIGQITNLCLGVKVNKNRVGAIYKELADREEMQLNQHYIGDDFKYLLIDGLWEVTKGYGWEDNKSVLICVLGIRANGERKILGFKLARKEDIANCSQLIKSLKDRGLKGENLELVISDDNPAFANVIQKYYPAVPIQNCIIHKMRNVLKKTKHRNKKQIGEDLKEIFNQTDRESAIKKSKEVVKRWYMSEKTAMESLRFNLETCFTYLDFPKEIWSKIRTTNILEREFREFRRRMKVFDNTFQNPESANRYANTITNYLNNNYPLKSLHTNA